MKSRSDEKSSWHPWVEQNTGLYKPYQQTKRARNKGRVNGGLFQKQPQQEGVTQLNYITIESIDKYAEKVEKLCGKILAPNQQVPTVSWIAVAQDPEGNQFGLLQSEMT
jgi:predicted enzyme related to lactoylglutathione lyase